ncbi:mitochondrial carrier [Dendrothele bispora CBS 962.96]|uniref:Mitochondrial carrier n=1 Tax=Dendrothele bispora (strain CBS 962.96) TaxID=1314807 RepID=A0A4S8LCA3_DENBC|nr:mitochondrial carrier [Dendrothele bispora CBS 962.96]
MVSGGLACGLTHAGMTPLDVAKCNMQENIEFHTHNSVLVKEEGTTGILKGVGPTLVGYSFQGMFKYGLYEVLKDFYMNLAGEEISSKYQGAIWLAASSSAEAVADVALCPFEMTKVKIQTSPSGTFPTSFGAALGRMRDLKAETRYPFGSLVPLWSRQIPYTMAKFYFFERTVQLFYTHVFIEPKDNYSKPTQLGITFASGYIAGVVSALVSHPADSLVSLQGRVENKGKSIGKIVEEVGFTRLMTKGLGTRIIMFGTLTGFQWWVYDTCKTIAGIGTTGGK